MLRVILTRGLPGSGKTTWAREQLKEHPQKYKIVCKDDLRRMLDNDVHNKSNEKFIEDARDSLILLALERNKNVIVADTNLSKRHENRITELVKGKAKVEIKDFTDISPDECVKRDLQRYHSVGEKVIWQIYQQFIRKHEPLIQDESKPKAIIVDLDGTLAIHDGRSPYDAAKCETDLPNDKLVKIIDSMSEDHKIILLSGRHDTYKPHTLRWLTKHNIIFDKLIMRKAGDDRKDDIIKQELFEEHIKDKYYVTALFDDRMRCVRLWKSMGLFVCNVGDSIEF